MLFMLSYNLQKMLKLLCRTPALLPRVNARLLASESARAPQDAETSSPSPAPLQQNPLDTRDFFGVHNLFNVKMLFDARMHLGHTVRSLNPQMNK